MKKALLTLLIAGMFGTTAWADHDGSEMVCHNSNVFLCENWEGRGLGSGDFSTPKYKSPGWANSRLNTQSIVTNAYSGSHGFQFTYPSGNNTGGGFMTVDFPGGPYRTVYYRWMTKYSPNYIWSAVATKHDEFYFSGTGARTPQLMWYSGSGQQVTKNVPDIFLYATSQGLNKAFSQNVTLPAVTVIPGQWYCMEVKITMNTCDSCVDGSFEGWIDGVQKFSYSNIATDTQGARTLKGLLMSSYWNCTGGGDSCTGGALDSHPLMYRWEDNHVASTSKIGCPGSTSGTPIPPPGAPTNLVIQ